MNRFWLFMALLLFMLLSGCQGVDDGSRDLLQSQIDELQSQIDEFKPDSTMDTLRSQAEEAQKQLEQATEKIAELQSELEEARRDPEDHDRFAVSSPRSVSPSGSEADESTTDTPPANASAAHGLDLQGLGSGISDSSLNASDRECIEIMKNSGTWGPSVTNLFPHMTPGGVETVIAIYLERHLFPGITTASGAKQVAATIEVALPYLSKDAQATVDDILTAFD